MRCLSSHLKLLLNTFKNYDSVNLSGTFTRGGKFFSFRLSYNLHFPEVNYRSLVLELWVSDLLNVTIRVETWGRKMRVSVKGVAKSRRALNSCVEKVTKLITLRT